MLQSSSKDRRGFIAKVADFGLARVCHGQNLFLDDFGTISHMPPESLLHNTVSPQAGEYCSSSAWCLRAGKRLKVPPHPDR